MTVNKVIFTDLDGTLFNDKSEVSDQNKEALITALDAGHKVYIATGRPLVFAKSIAQKIDPRVKVVCFNGAVYEIEDLVVHTIPSNKFRALSTFLLNQDIQMNYKTVDTLYYNNKDKQVSSYDHLGMPSVKGIESCDEDKLIKILALQGNKSDETILDIVNTLKNDFEVNYYGGLGFELIDKDLTKGSAILKVMEGLNIDPIHSIIFGDDVNDTSMFEIAGTCVATANAVDSIKERADYISTHCNHSSIAHGLKHLKII